jgi:hypothetical protein
MPLRCWRRDSHPLWPFVPHAPDLGRGIETGRCTADRAGVDPLDIGPGKRPRRGCKRSQFDNGLSAVLDHHGLAFQRAVDQLRKLAGILSDTVRAHESTVASVRVKSRVFLRSLLSRTLNRAVPGGVRAAYGLVPCFGRDAGNHLLTSFRQSASIGIVTYGNPSGRPHGCVHQFRPTCADESQSITATV